MQLPKRYLCAADLMVSVSDYEGLSLDHLEAISMGLPVVAYSAGGTDEIGSEDAGLHTLPVGADLIIRRDRIERLARHRKSDSTWSSHQQKVTIAL